MKIYFDDSRAGDGKTTRAIEQLVSEPVRAIYSLEQVEKMDEIRALIGTKAAAAGNIVRVFEIHNLTAMSVRKAVCEIPESYGHHQHVIVLITHAALLQSATNGFAGWQLVIDEVPSMLITEEPKTPISYKTLAERFTLTPINDEWSTIGLTSEGRNLKATDVASDKYLDIDSLYRAVVRSEISDSNIVARLQNWDQASDGKAWFIAHWFSFFDVESFDRVTVLGNGFLSSVAVRLVRRKDDEIAAMRGETIEWIALPRADNATTPVRRKVTIRYFDEDHATRTKMSTETGKANLRTKANYLSTVLPADFIWSANNNKANKENSVALMSPFILMRSISPRQAGSNLHRHVHCAVFFYVANPSPNIVSFLKLNGIDPAAWRSTQEHEASLQFVTRTSIRDADSDHDVEFYLLDKFDAQYCADYFVKIGHDVRVEFVDLNLEEQIDGRTGERNITKALGRPTLDMTVDERAQHDRAQNRRRVAESRARKKASKLAA